VLLRRHQLSDSRLKNLVLAFVGLCHRLIIFVRRKTGDCHLSILELANQENIAYRQSRKLECFLNTLAFFCFSHGHRLMSASPGSCGQFNAPDRKAGGDGKNPTPFNFHLTSFHDPLSLTPSCFGKAIKGSTAKQPKWPSSTVYMTPRVPAFVFRDQFLREPEWRTFHKCRDYAAILRGSLVAALWGQWAYHVTSRDLSKKNQIISITSSKPPIPTPIWGPRSSSLRYRPTESEEIE
jgi:hypothetical protein